MDIIKRMLSPNPPDTTKLLLEAADEIERLRAALGEIDGSRRIPPYLTREEMILVAREALNEQITNKLSE